MTFVSISIAFPLAAVVAYAIGVSLVKRGLPPGTATLWCFTLSLLVGIAVLLSGTPRDLVRAVWPREAVDWLGWIAVCFTAMTVGQTSKSAPSISTPFRPLVLTVGMLVGICVVCRLLFGSIYLRPAQTSVNSLSAIALAGVFLGCQWYVEHQRQPGRSWQESLVAGLWLAGISVTLAMSGSMQYGMVGGLIGLASLAAWAATGQWPWLSQTVGASLLGLGLAFAEVQLFTLIGFGFALAMLPIADGTESGLMAQRIRALTLFFAAVVVVILVVQTGKQFLDQVNGNKVDYGGYETLK